MKAPDKVFFPNDINLLTILCLRMEQKGDVCYIRKDALLEWLDGKLTIEGATEGYVGGYDSALKDVINKLNSM